MVFYSQQAIKDLSGILTGLVSWVKHPLAIEHAKKYVSDIRMICDKLDTRTIILMHNFLPIKDTGKRFIITNKINKPFGSSFIISTSMETYMFNV